MKDSHNKKVLKTAVCLGAAAGAVCAASYLTGELYRYSFTREGSALFTRLTSIGGGNTGHEQDYYDHRDSLKAAAQALPQLRFTIPSARGENLAGFYFPCEGGDGRHIAVIIHGYRSEHAETCGMYLDFYHRHGFDVFAPDNTAHGESEGRFIGFDVFESEDALRWLDFLRRRAGDGVQFILHGFSLGGATVMKMSDRVGPDVKFIVEDSGYTEAQSLLRRSPLFPQLKAIHKKLAGVDLGDTDVRPNLERASVPILFVQGTEDKLVPAENGPYLYDFYQGPKDCLFVPGAKHIEAMHVDPAGYEAALEKMIGEYVV